mgnify:CR=1 FL=1
MQSSVDDDDEGWAKKLDEDNKRCSWCRRRGSEYDDDNEASLQGSIVTIVTMASLKPRMLMKVTLEARTVMMVTREARAITMMSDAFNWNGFKLHGHTNRGLGWSTDDGGYRERHKSMKTEMKKETRWNGTRRLDWCVNDWCWIPWQVFILWGTSISIFWRIFWNLLQPSGTFQNFLYH